MMRKSSSIALLGLCLTLCSSFGTAQAAQKIGTLAVVSTPSTTAQVSLSDTPTEQAGFATAINPDIPTVTPSLTPTPNPQGSGITFTNQSDGKIYMMQADGSHQHILADMTAKIPNLRYISNVKWSPNGQYATFNAETKSGGAMYLMNANGSKIAPIRPPLSGGYIMDAAWSPNSEQLAVVGGPGSIFDSDAATKHAIFVMNVGGSSLKKIIDNAESPSWSPDGKYIAFFRWQYGADAGIYAVKSDGTGKPVQIVHDDIDALLAWSPDNTYIAYATDHGNNSCIIYLLRGTTRTKIYEANFQSSCDGLSWSPDSRRIVFDVYQALSKNDAIFVMDASGSNVKQLTQWSEDDISPNWVP